MVFGTYVGVVDRLRYKNDIQTSFTFGIPTNTTWFASKYETRWIGQKMLGCLSHEKLSLRWGLVLMKVLVLKRIFCKNKEKKCCKKQKYFLPTKSTVHGVNNAGKKPCLLWFLDRTLISLSCTALWRVKMKLFILYLFSLSFFSFLYCMVIRTLLYFTKRS